MIDQHTSLGEKFLKKGVWLYLFSFIIAPIGYIIKILIAGEVSVSELGILYGVISLIALLGAFSDLGLGESLKFFIPQYQKEKQYSKIKSILLYTFIIQSISGVLLACLFFFGSDFIAQNYFKTSYAADVLKIFSLFFLGINLFQIIAQFFLAIQNTLYYKICEFIRTITILIFIVSAIYLDLNSLTILSLGWIAGLYVGVFFSAIIFFKKYYIVYLKGEPIDFSKALFRKICGYAMMVFLSVQVAVILSQVDMQMIIYLLGSQDAGYYTTYLSLIMIPFLIVGPIFLILMPIFSELYGKKEFEKIKNIKFFFSKYFIVIGVFFSLFLFIFSHEIAYILFGPAFEKSSEILRYSCLLLMFNFLFQINFNILGGTGKVNLRFKITAVSLIINVVLNFIFIKLIGVSGAALATGIGWFLIWIMSEIALGKQYQQTTSMKYIVKNIGLLGVLAIVSQYFILPYISDYSRLESLFLILGIGLFWLLYFCCINLSQGKDFIGEIKKLKSGKK